MDDDEKTSPGHTKNLTPSEPVLLVEDDPAARDLSRTILEEHGYTVVTANHGREALDLLLSLKPEPFVVVLDLVMPVLDGWQLIAIMRSYRRLSLIPVVVQSAADVPPEARDVFEVFLPKPITPALLLAAVTKIAVRRQ